MARCRGRDDEPGRAGAADRVLEMYGMRMVDDVIYLPEQCLRGLTTCEPLGQIAGEDEDGNIASFFCCGQNDGTDRGVDQDRYTLCFRNHLVDQRTHNDKRDLVHQIAVISQALAVIEEREART